MKFTATFVTPTLGLQRWKADLRQDMEDALERGVVAWLNAALAPIPVWSGASHGTFRELAARVNFVLAISPTANGARLGLGPAAGQAASTGRLFGNPNKGEYFAEYSTTLRHLVYNEFFDGNTDPRVFSQLRHPTPYSFQIAANNAFRQVASSTRLPVIRFQDGKKITV